MRHPKKVGGGVFIAGLCYLPSSADISPLEHIHLSSRTFSSLLSTSPQLQYTWSFLQSWDLMTVVTRRWEGIFAAGLFGVMAALPLFFDFAWTNTLNALVIADLILLLIGFGVYRAISGGSLVPKGFSGAIEALLEVIYNLTEGTAGKWAKFIFPWFATITLLVLVANWMELIPMVDSVGLIEPQGHYAVQDLGWANALVNPRLHTLQKVHRQRVLRWFHSCVSFQLT